MTWLALSFGLYALCELAWTSVFALLLRRAYPRSVGVLRLNLHCLIGSFSPGNMGSEALRAWLNLRRFGIPPARTLLSSVYASVLKLRVGSALAAFLLARHGWAAAAPAALCAASFLPRWHRRTAGAFPRVSPRAHASIAAVFAVGFLAEMAAFAACMRALAIAPPPAWPASFAWMHLAARVPFLPQGLLLTEAAGYLAFARALDPEQALALMGAWAAVRVVTPLVLGAATFRAGNWSENGNVQPL